MKYRHYDTGLEVEAFRFGFDPYPEWFDDMYEHNKVVIVFDTYSNYKSYIKYGTHLTARCKFGDVLMRVYNQHAERYYLIDHNYKQFIAIYEPVEE